MAIDPSSIQWDDAPQIDPAGVMWDDAPAQAMPAQAVPEPMAQTAPPSHQAGRFGNLPALPDNAGKELMQGAGNILGGALRGAGSIGATIVAPYDIVQDLRAGKGLSLESNRQRRSDMDWALQDLGAQPDSMAFKGGKLGAEIAGTAGAGGVLARGAAMLPGASKIAPLIESIGTGGFRNGGMQGLSGLATRGAGGAITGGTAAGLVDPDSAGLGAALGGAFPVSTKLLGGLGKMIGSGAKSIVEPLHEAGQEQIIGRALNQFAGGRSEEAARNMMSAKELVPGSSPTVAEAAGVPSLSALQRASVNVSPEAANALESRLMSNNQARINALEEISGSPEARRAAQDARDNFANVFYTAAKNSDNMRQDQIAMQAIDPRTPMMRELGIGNPPPSPITPSDGLKELAARPAMKAFIRSARDMAENSGEKIGDPLTSVTGLHYIKLAMDDALTANPLTAMARNEKRNVMSMKEALSDEIDSLSPLYSLARHNFHTASQPLSQMDVAQALLGTVNPLNGKLRAFQYANKLNDKTAASATGFKGSTLENTMTQEQLQILNNLKDDLSRAEFGANAGRPVGTNTVQNLAYGNMLNQFGVPNILRGSPLGQVAGGLLGKAGDLVYGKANKEIAEKLARIMLDPKEAVKVMTAKKPQNPILLKAAEQGLLSTSKVLPAITAQ